MSSEALAKEDWSFGGLRRNIGATGSCPWGSTELLTSFLAAFKEGPVCLRDPEIPDQDVASRSIDPGLRPA